MEKKIFLIIPILVVIFAFGKNFKDESKRVKILVVSYNVENLMDTLDNPNAIDEEFTPMTKKNWNTERYNKKINDLATVLCSIDDDQAPDLIGLVEVENRKVVEDLMNNEQFGAKNYKIVHEETTDHRGIDLAFVYNPKVFKYISHEQLHVFDNEGKPYRTREILHVKGIVGKDTMYVFVNHWKSRSGGTKETEEMRIWSAKVLKSKIDYVLKINPNANILCLGDFNDTPFNKSISEVVDASLDSIFTSKNEIYNLTAYEAKKKRGTYSYNGEWFMLDNILISQNMMNKKNRVYAPEPAKIFDDDMVSFYNPKADHKTPNKTYGGKNYYGGISDHFATYVYFIVKK